MQKLWIYGAGGHAAVAVDIITNMKNFEIVGFIDDAENLKDKIFFDHITFISNFKKFKKINQDFNVFNMFFAIGDNLTREKLSNRLTDFKFPTIIHNTAIISKRVEIGCGTVIMPGTIIENKAKIGQHCIINNHAIVGHSSVIDDFCHIGGGAVLSGQTIVEKGSLIGIGACITPTIKIGKYCVIGAGSIITRDVPDDTFMMGNPARVISNYLKNSLK